MARTILIVSGKGGVGKTTSAINLAFALHAEGKDVMLVDSSLSTPDVGLHLGAPIIPVSFHHVLAGKATPKEAVYHHSSGMKVLPGSISLRDMRVAKPERMKKAISTLKKHADFLIVDSAAGFSRETLHAIESASELIVVTNPDLPSVTNALKAVKIAESMHRAVTGVIVTRSKGKKIEMSLKDISDMLETNVLGIVPEDDSVGNAISHKEILMHAYPRSKAARAYRKIASKLLGRRQEEREGFFEGLLNALGFKK